ncbi:MAG: aa3-type cytochrome c oxidase subunit IV [Pseudolabrys sp.]
MADHGTVEYATAPGNDYETHEQTYLMFLKLVKWHVIVIPIILILMAYFLV